MSAPGAVCDSVRGADERVVERTSTTEPASSTWPVLFVDRGAQVRVGARARARSRGRAGRAGRTRRPWCGAGCRRRARRSVGPAATSGDRTVLRLRQRPPSSPAPGRVPAPAWRPSRTGASATAAISMGSGGRRTSIHHGSSSGTVTPTAGRAVDSVSSHSGQSSPVACATIPNQVSVEPVGAVRVEPGVVGRGPARAEHHVGSSSSSSAVGVGLDGDHRLAPLPARTVQPVQLGLRGLPARAAPRHAARRARAGSAPPRPAGRPPRHRPRRCGRCRPGRRPARRPTDRRCAGPAGRAAPRGPRSAASSPSISASARSASRTAASAARTRSSGTSARSRWRRSTPITRTAAADRPATRTDSSSSVVGRSATISSAGPGQRGPAPAGDPGPLGVHGHGRDRRRQLHGRDATPTRHRHARWCGRS